jgi:type IV secretion system protein VirD4
MELHSYAHTAEETRAGIRSTFLQGLTPYIRSDGIISMMSGDDLKIHELDGETPTAIFINVPDESPTYDGICGIIANELLTHYVRMAHDRYNGRLPRRLNVVLEEFGNIGHAIPNLPHLMAAGRSRNVRCHIILQTIAQLVDIYGPAKATSVRENASVMIAYRSTHWDSLNELSRLCGEQEVERNGHFLREPLITPADLSAMQIGQALVTITGGIKFITWLPDFTEVFPVNGAKAPKRLPHSTRKPPVHFDIQKYVKDAKQRKMDEMMNRHPDPFSAMAQAPVATPKPEPFFDIDKLVAKIDAKIAELEEEEKTGEQDQTGHFTVTLVSCLSKLGAIKVLRNAMPLSLRDAKDIVDNLPFKKTFTSLKEAKAFASELTEATGTVTTEGF